MLIVVCSTKVSNQYNKHMNKNVLKNFGQKIRELRVKENLSQEALAERALVHRTYIGMIERAEKNITLSNIEKLAKALNASISELFRGIEE